MYLSALRRHNNVIIPAVTTENTTISIEKMEKCSNGVEAGWVAAFIFQLHFYRGLVEH